VRSKAHVSVHALRASATGGTCVIAVARRPLSDDCVGSPTGRAINAGAEVREWFVRAPIWLPIAAAARRSAHLRANVDRLSSGVRAPSLRRCGRRGSVRRSRRYFRLQFVAIVSDYVATNFRASPGRREFPNGLRRHPPRSPSCTLAHPGREQKSIQVKFEGLHDFEEHNSSGTSGM
jgi:hypothetical protein